jgi:hypothetical protein
MVSQLNDLVLMPFKYVNDPARVTHKYSCRPYMFTQREGHGKSSLGCWKRGSCSSSSWSPIYIVHAKVSLHSLAVGRELPGLQLIPSIIIKFCGVLSSALRAYPSSDTLWCKRPSRAEISSSPPCSLVTPSLTEKRGLLLTLQVRAVDAVKQYRSSPRFVGLWNGSCEFARAN